MLQDLKEIIWLRGYRSYHSNLHGSVWIGGYKRNNRWFWRGQLTDTPVTITDWATYAPDNGGDGNENCLELFGVYSQGDEGRNYRWNDLSCNAKRGYICNK